MKKTTLLLLMLFITTLSFAQVLNEPASWPNSSWTITGTYSTATGVFEANPTVASNFAYDDNGAGSGSNNTIAAESPVTDLTAAFNAGEIWIYFSGQYVFNKQNTDILAVQYWDADAAAWVNWGAPFTTDTPGVGNNNYCANTPISYTSPLLDITAFTATQLAGFKYRIYYTDSGIWAKGFCFSSPTVYSDAPPTCPDLSGVAVTAIAYNSVTFTWTAGGSETAWDVAVQPAGTGVPTSGWMPAGPTSTYTWTPLDPITPYEIYVRANCGAGDYSNWVGPVNFTTYNTPPIPPDGVACPTSSYIFTEDFDTPGFWTGNINTNGGSWEIPNGSTSANTGANTAYSGSSFMNFEATNSSPTPLPPGSIVSPAIDLNGATGEIEMSFYMHAYGASMGTLEVGVGTSPTGPFTTEFTWVGQLQTSGTQPWVPVGVDLTAYANQIIYIQFKQTVATPNTGTGDMSIDYLRIQACGSFCVAPSGITAYDLTDVGGMLTWTPNNGESAWYYVVQPAGTGVPTGTGTLVTSLPIDLSTITPALTPDTEYEVYVMAACGGGFNSIWSNPYTFRTEIQTVFDVDCNVGPTNVNFCYENNDTTVFQFTASDPSQYLTVHFNSGMTEAGDDELIVYDSDGTTVLYTGYGNAGNLAGLTIPATGSVVYVAVTSDGINSCANGGINSPWDFEVYCTTCLNPTATYSVTDDCDNQQYYVDVNIATMGDATSLTITDDQGSPAQSATGLGTFTFGPYPLSVGGVVMSMTHDQDGSCVVNSPVLTNSCPPMEVSTTTYTVPELVTDVLINSQCAQVSNIQWSGASTAGANFESIGYFYNAFQFDFPAGVVLSSGDVSSIVGPNDFNVDESDTWGGWNGDADLSAATGETNLNNATYIEFDFVPLTTSFSFDFLFASEEYQAAFECTYSDVFAFILTDSAGNSTNLAVIPDTTIPVTVVNIHGNENTTCGPANIEYFEGYNYTGTGEINFNGQTVVMTASADVVVGETYHIKLAIADEGDSSLNSAVFLGAGTFNIGDLDLGDDILLTGGNANCEGDDVVLDAGTIPDNASIVWYADDEPIPGETSSTLAVTETATYKAIITYDNSNCSFQGQVLIEFFPIPEPYFDETVLVKGACAEGTLVAQVDNLADLLGNVIYTWYDANDMIVQEGPSNTYVLAADAQQEGIFTVEVKDDTNNCAGTAEIEVQLIGEVIAGQAPDMDACDDISNDGMIQFDLTTQDAAIINGQTDVVVSYYASAANAEAGTGALSSPYTNTTPYVQTIYARIDKTTSSCYDISTFDLIVYDTPILLFENYYDVCSNGVTPTIITGQNVDFELTDPGVSIVWTKDGSTLADTDNSIEVLDAGMYTVTVTTANCSNYYEINVHEASGCIIPQGISPGTGDTTNERFDLDGFDIAHIAIFNRMGTEVYTKSNYTDEWYGQTDKGEELPVGTYFYVLTQGNGNKITGWVYVNRKN